jgi:hypothetical protein
VTLERFFFVGLIVENCLTGRKVFKPLPFDYLLLFVVIEGSLPTTLLIADFSFVVVAVGVCDLLLLLELNLVGNDNFFVILENYILIVNWSN